MNRIRLLRVIGRLNVGGPAAQIDVLVDGLDPYRFEHRIIAGLVEEGEADHLELRGSAAQVQRLATGGREIDLVADVRAVAHLRREIGKFQPEILHTHTAKAGVLARTAALSLPRGRRPKMVHTFHGHLLRGYFGPLGTAAVRAVERTLGRRTDRLVAVGTRVRDQLLAARIGDIDRFVVIPPAVRLRRPPTREEARRQLDVPAEVPVVVFVGRLTRIKRPDRFAAVIAELQRQVPDLVALVAGDGPAAGHLDVGGATIRRLGWRPDVETVLAAGDVVLLTSDNEGMPVSLIETALCGRPAVTTDVGSAREVVMHARTGLVVPSDVMSLVDAVASLIRDPVRAAAFGAAASRFAQERFAPVRLVADYAELYEDLVRKP